jgi:peptidoglycan/xylan/chitin deacetylase (PgdA/CDA1 family)
MNYSFPERVMLYTRKSLNSHIFTKKVRGDFDNAFVSFTFDDVPGCTFDYATPILDKYGVKATFYISGSLCKDKNTKYLSQEQITKLLEKGHEIGCHTYSHVKSGFTSPKAFAYDLRQNKQFFTQNFKSVALNNFSYPNGSVGIWNKPLVNRIYSSARTTCCGINVKPIDLGFLLAYKLYSGKLDLGDISKLINLAKSLNGWLIFYTHDVCPKPSKSGCEPELFEYAVRKASESGMEILNIKDVLARIGASLQQK